MLALVEVATPASSEDVFEFLVAALAEGFEIKAAFVYEPVDGKTNLARTLGKRAGRNVVVSVIGTAVALALSAKPAAA